MSAALQPAAEPPAPFDYAAVAAAHREDVRQAAVRIRAHHDRAAAELVAAGNELLAVKAVLPHGQFQQWLAAEFAFSSGYARKLMATARRLKTVPGYRFDIEGLPIDPSAVLALTAKSAPDVALDEALDRAKTGEKVTKSKAQAIVARHRQPPPEPEPAPAAQRVTEQPSAEPSPATAAQPTEGEQELFPGSVKPRRRRAKRSVSPEQALARVASA